MEDHNTIKEWLDPLLDSRGLSVEVFASLSGLSRASVYFYRADTARPTEESMASMCGVLGVPFEEGLKQYTPRQRGFPKGKSRENDQRGIRKRHPRRRLGPPRTATDTPE